MKQSRRSEVGKQTKRGLPWEIQQLPEQQAIRLPVPVDKIPVTCARSISTSRGKPLRLTLDVIASDDGQFYLRASAPNSEIVLCSECFTEYRWPAALRERIMTVGLVVKNGDKPRDKAVTLKPS